MVSKRRLKLGIIFSENENWIGGSYYLLNLISSFNYLPDVKQPEVIIISDKKSDFNFVMQTNYRHLTFLNYQQEIPYNFLQRFLFRLFPRYSKRNFKTYFNKNHFAVVFPYVEREKLKKVKKKVYWYPDFQEHYFPDFFSENEIRGRKKLQNEFVNRPVRLILSSQAALDDFKRIYPKYNCYPAVVNFAVTHPNYQHLSIAELKNKFFINGDYFISPNQFWQHKNHLTVLKAVKYLKEMGRKIQVVFTGKEFDYRNPSYTEQLKSFVIDNNIDDCIRFLGFIDRAEQLQLMNHSLGVIQPSLFEGWSTVIEDAKAMNQFVIASDIPVHNEQLKSNVIFFECHNYIQLSEILWNNQRMKRDFFVCNYEDSIKKFANDFLNAIE